MLINYVSLVYDSTFMMKLRKMCFVFQIFFVLSHLLERRCTSKILKMLSFTNFCKFEIEFLENLENMEAEIRE
jgi:hypothetical protein